MYPQHKCGDADGDGDRDLLDYHSFRDCYSGEDPDNWEPGCELMDYQGDCDVDLPDFDMFLDEYDDELIDCNGNGIPDLRDILAGDAIDADHDGYIDGCALPLTGDLNDDGSVDLIDLLEVIANWGSCTGCPPACAGDANDDCLVDLDDLLLVIANWGSSV